MKRVHYTDLEAQVFDGGPVAGVRGRVLVGKADGAENFCMRIFEVAEGGHSPRHSHEWEHEIFVHSGAGEVFTSDGWQPISAGTALFIPGGEEHQMRNTGTEPLVFVCLIPSGVPEL